jgi:hypothetical protein
MGSFQYISPNRFPSVRNTSSMKKFFLTALAVFSLASYAASRDNPEPESSTYEAGFELLPRGTSFMALVASYQEPHTGLRKEIGSSRMKLEIGTTLDLLAYQFEGPEISEIRVGADLFAYGLTTSSQGLRLQIDAVDGLFGGHLAFRHGGGRSLFAIRLRILHHSAHFVDGHYDLSSESWKGDRVPNPYTRDFGELVLAHRWILEQVSLRLYGGVSYATLARPEEVQRWAGQAGIEFQYEVPGDGVFGKPFSIYLADHFSLNGVPAYRGSNNLEGGIKFGRWHGTGLRFYLNYHSGLEPFGQYFDLFREHWGVGFALDVF